MLQSRAFELGCLLFTASWHYTVASSTASSRAAFLPPSNGIRGVDDNDNLPQQRHAQQQTQPRLSSRRAGPLFGSLEQEAEKLRQQAAKLREEVESFNQRKSDIAEEEQQQIQAELDERQAYIDRYSAVVPILKPDGSSVDEKVQFPRRLPEDDNSIISVHETMLPLGLILGESETMPGATVVDEIADGSNGGAAGIQVGDLVRGFTACRMEMAGPTWQLMAGGIGTPKTMRFMYSADFRPFEEVMEAVASNRMDPEGRPVVLVVERSAASAN
mmetsp:Transcript_7784/g.21013  ORF Transcript_7784/g.21013 Transcript_7784/m.21013 type:complete len:273 (-) Transcript_7784:240-1058(-)|eukprot:CAMPEP_0198124722 /NCGR_PEP_ID=MMETSP1442-20131203/40715_1 /TAXON_ID= /ORGANISM="Craspedostauros australis, Strain CCMP3328" /LENGTH=272 /DNA_ID=CAMNT_0043784187 /DNA_START=53 /DNA_END=871 /DNA_ORIENTATION=+